MIAGPSSRRSNGYQHWEKIQACHSKTSLIGGDSPSPVNTHDFMKMVYQQRNISTGRTNKANSINHHQSTFASRFPFSHIQNSKESNWTRSSALGPVTSKKYSIDSGHQSMLLSPAPILSKPSSHPSFNGGTGGVLVF